MCEDSTAWPFLGFLWRILKCGLLVGCANFRRWVEGFWSIRCTSLRVATWALPFDRSKWNSWAEKETERYKRANFTASYNLAGELQQSEIRNARLCCQAFIGSRRNTARTTIEAEFCALKILKLCGLMYVKGSRQVCVLFCKASNSLLLKSTDFVFLKWGHTCYQQDLFSLLLIVVS